MANKMLGVLVTIASAAMPFEVLTSTVSTLASCICLSVNIASKPRVLAIRLRFSKTFSWLSLVLNEAFKLLQKPLLTPPMRPKNPCVIDMFFKDLAITKGGWHTFCSSVIISKNTKLLWQKLTHIIVRCKNLMLLLYLCKKHSGVDLRWQQTILLMRKRQGL